VDAASSVLLVHTVGDAANHPELRPQKVISDGGFADTLAADDDDRASIIGGG